MMGSTWKRDRQTVRQRQADGQTDTDTDRQKQRHTQRQRQSYRQTHRLTETRSCKTNLKEEGETKQASGTGCYGKMFDLLQSLILRWLIRADALGKTITKTEQTPTNIARLPILLLNALARMFTAVRFLLLLCGWGGGGWEEKGRGGGESISK